MTETFNMNEMRNEMRNEIRMADGSFMFGILRSNWIEPICSYRQIALLKGISLATTTKHELTNNVYVIKYDWIET